MRLKLVTSDVDAVTEPEKRKNERLYVKRLNELQFVQDLSNCLFRI